MHLTQGTYRLLILSFLFSLSFLAVNAQDVKVNIEAPDVVQVGEQFRVVYTVDSDQPVENSFSVGDFDNFENLYGPAVSRSSSTSQGSKGETTVYSTSYAYVLGALKRGKFALPRGEVSLGNKTYKSDSHKIVVKAPDAVSNAEQKGAKANKNTDIKAFVKTIVSKTRMNESDTLMLTYRLYTNIEASKIIDSNFPSIRGFYTNNATQSRQRFREEKIDGVTYKVIDIMVLVLQPRSEGLKEIPEGSITLEYAIPTGRKVRNQWGAVYNEVVRTRRTLTIEGVNINVQNLVAV